MTRYCGNAIISAVPQEECDMVFDCSGPRFGAMKNPYTGEIIRVKMSTSSTGAIRFFAPDTYSPTNVYPTAKEAYRNWNRVNGVEGVKDGKPIVCAYTGRPLHLVKTDDGFCYEGGFNIHLMYDRPTFLHFATMRDGVSEYPEPSPEERVGAPAPKGRITKRQAKHADEMKTELTEEGVRTAEGIMKELKGKFGIEGSSTVSMAGKGK